MVGFWIGKYVDQKLNAHNLLLALGVILGFAAGIYKFYIDAKRFLK